MVQFYQKVNDMRDIREFTQQTFVSHGRQPEVEYFPFWQVFAPHNGREKLLLDVCGLMLQTWWRQNAPNRKNSWLTNVCCVNSLLAERSQTLSKTSSSV